MKKMHAAPAGLIFFLCALCEVLQAQPWSPLKFNEKFNFKVDGFNFITNTIWSDSVKTGEGDSVFYLNRIVTGCDTCMYWYKWSDQPDFLKSRMIRNISGILIKKVPCTGTINISNLLPGYYFISIIETGNEKTWNGEFIKQ